MASSTGVDLSVSGLASGFDWKSLVTQLAQAERAPKTVWQANQSKLNQQNSIYGSIKSYLRNVQAYAQKLKDPALYEARSALSSSASVASASASAGGLTGTFSFNISHLATAAVLNGTSGISNILVPGGDPNSMTVRAAGVSAPLTAGTFTRHRRLAEGGRRRPNFAAPARRPAEWGGRARGVFRARDRRHVHRQRQADQ